MEHLALYFHFFLQLAIVSDQLFLILFGCFIHNSWSIGSFTAALVCLFVFLTQSSCFDSASSALVVASFSNVFRYRQSILQITDLRTQNVFVFLMLQEIIEIVFSDAGIEFSLAFLAARHLFPAFAAACDASAWFLDSVVDLDDQPSSEKLWKLKIH